MNGLKALSHILILSFLTTQDVFAVCTTLIKGPVAINVKSCAAIVPETAFSMQDSKYSFIRDLPPVNRKAFLDTYRGSLIKGTVAASQAIRSGISDEKGALSGESISAFIPGSGVVCETLASKTIDVHLAETCCDGGGAVPCLLDTGYMLSHIKVSDAKAKSKSIQDKRSPEVAALYAKAKQALSVSNYQGAAAVLEQLHTSNQLDIFGQYQLGALYRQLDKCAAALPLLEGLHKKFLAKDYWTDSEMPVRKGTFLYARCLSMTNRGAESVLVLQGFLVEPTVYQAELKESLTHRDFGYIHTSKSFINYKASVERALK